MFFGWFYDNGQERVSEQLCVWFWGRWWVLRYISVRTENKGNSNHSRPRRRIEFPSPLDPLTTDPLGPRLLVVLQKHAVHEFWLPAKVHIVSARAEAGGHDLKCG